MVRPVRLAIIAMTVFLIGGLAYAILSATSKGNYHDPVSDFATGELASLTTERAGEAAPDSGFTGPDGQPATLGDLQGKTLLVNYWATWCAPCERELPSLGELQRARGGEDFDVIAISIDAEEDKAYARQRLGELGGNTLDFYHTPPEAWEVVYDASVSGFPTSILYGPDGVEIARLPGEADWSSYEAVALIDKLLDR